MAQGQTMRRRLAVDRQQLLILLVAAVMAGSFFLLVLWPKQKELSALGAAVERERATIREQVRTSREGVYVGVRIAALRKASGTLAHRLPSDPQVADFLRQVAERVAAERLVHEVERIEPDPGAPGEATPSVPIRLRLSGGFDAVYRCLAAVEGLERVTRIRRLQVKSAGENGEVAAEVDLLVYYLPSAEVAATPGASKTPEVRAG